MNLFCTLQNEDNIEDYSSKGWETEEDEKKRMRTTRMMPLKRKILMFLMRYYMTRMEISLRKKISEKD